MHIFKMFITAVCFIFLIRHRTDDAIEQNGMGGDPYDYFISSRVLHSALSDNCLTSYNLGSILK